jgi:DNA-binding PadR family transcriptional regulator
VTGFLSRWVERRRAIVLQAFTFPRAPLSSLEILTRVGADPGNAFFAWSGGVYRTLHALVEDGLAISYDVPAPPPIDAMRGGRPRRYYELTDQGLAARAAVNAGRFL